MHFYPGTITTRAASIDSDLQRGLDRRLRHTQHWTQNRTSLPLRYQERYGDDINFIINEK